MRSRIMIMMIMVLSMSNIVLLDHKQTAAKALMTMSETIGIHVSLCRQEVGFDDSMIKNLKNFWNDDEDISDTDMGCVINCALKKMELVTSSFELNVVNAEAFGKACGTSESIFNALKQLYQMCLKVAEGAPCDKALDIARCFRAGILQLDWQPDPDAGYDDQN